MKRVDTTIEGLCRIEPSVFGDSRGFFMETYNKQRFSEIGIVEEFVQDNHSRSARGVLRGLHFQRCNPQGKLVRVVAGSVLDVAVDLRLGSATYGRWESFLLSAENKHQLYIPPCFAHGFVSLEEGTEFVYKCTTLYDQSSDGGVRWDDPTIGVDWELERFGLSLETIQLSAKDMQLPLLKEAEIRFGK